MTIYVAEIAGRAIVAFDAADDAAAKARLADRAFQRDLIVFQNEGRPLWDGVSEIRLRGALPAEAETLQRSVAGQPGSAGEEEERRVFLVPVVDPSRFADDDDDHDDHDDHDRGD
jgi:hypothetical protein